MVPHHAGQALFQPAALPGNPAHVRRYRDRTHNIESWPIDLGRAARRVSGKAGRGAGPGRPSLPLHQGFLRASQIFENSF